MDKQYQKWYQSEQQQAQNAWFWGRLVIAALDSVLYIVIALIQAACTM